MNSEVSHKEMSLKSAQSLRYGRPA